MVELELRVVWMP